MSDDIERLIFGDDIREKKRTSSGARHRASRKKGFKGGVTFPMNRSDKNYSASGKVIRYMQYSSFMAIKDTEKRREVLRDMLMVQGLTPKQIAELMGVKIHAIHDHCYRLGLSKPRKKKKLIGEQKGDRQMSTKVNEPAFGPPAPPPVLGRIDIKDGVLDVKYVTEISGTMSAFEARQLLSGIACTLLDGRNYSIELMVIQSDKRTGGASDGQT